MRFGSLVGDAEPQTVTTSFPTSVEELSDKVKADWEDLLQKMKDFFKVDRFFWEPEPTIIKQTKVVPAPATKAEVFKVLQQTRKEKALLKAGVDPATAKAMTKPTTTRVTSKVPLLTVAQQKSVPRATIQGFGDEFV